MDDYVLLSDLATVLGEPANTLAQVIKRGGFSLPDADLGRGTGNWTKFSMADVAVFALIRALTNLGMQTRTASEAAQYVVEKGKVGLADLDAFIERWRAERLVVSRQDREWSFLIFPARNNKAYPPAYVALDVAQIVDDATQRAKALAERRERRRA